VKRGADFESLLKQAIGLDANSIGSSAIEQAVGQRLAACELDDAGAYLERVRSSEAELRALIEAVVVPETWFFRDPEAFVALVRIARERRPAASAEHPLKLLSLPCSSGEEPYSMAIVLLDGGFAPRSFAIDAVDISEQALAKAERGTYGKNSFRARDLSFRERHFRSVQGSHELHDTVKKAVRFRHGNLLELGSLLVKKSYDAVFCRNVLIYFDRPTQDRAVSALESLLSAQGVLFVAPSETALLLDHGFASLKIPLAFAFRRKESAPAAAPAPVRRARHAPSQPAAPLQPPRRKSLSPARARSKRPPGAASTRARTAAAAGLEEARRLADGGELSRAARLCESVIADQGPSAAALYLLGVIHDASGNAAAAGTCYRKALYLEPTHGDALSHLVALLETEGDLSGAEIVRSRVQRLAKKGKG
jgi:chemotaxis protein methyltransferase WspC